MILVFFEYSDFCSSLSPLHAEHANTNLSKDHEHINNSERGWFSLRRSAQTTTNHYL